MGSISSPGLGSGLDINGLVSQLVAAEAQAPTARLDRRETDLQVRLSAYGSLKGAVSQFQTSLVSLQNISGYQAKSITSSDSAVLTATASSSAQAASYDLNVTQLAEKQRLSTDPVTNVNARFTDVTDVIGTGTLTFKFGTTDYTSGTDTYNSFTQNPDTASKTIKITDGSLQGIRDAVNEADIGVTAAIIFDGTYQRLTFSSGKDGAANSIQVVTDDADGNDTDASGLSLLAFNDAGGVGGTTNLAQNTAAQDSLFTVNGISISSESKSVKNVIDGITLNLKTTGTSTIDITVDSEAATSAINSFVESYNGLISNINDLTSYDPDTGQAGQLNGDGIVRGLASQVKRLLGNPVDAGNGAFSILSDIGITTNATTGLLDIDNDKLADAINGNVDDVIGLFAAFGRPTDTLVSFDSATDATLEGNYNISITSLATKGSLTGSAAANLTISTGINDAISIKVDGITADITLTAGTYTASSLIAEVQSQINSSTALSTANSSVVVTETSGVLSITSERFGSASDVVIVGGNGSADLLGTSPTNTIGKDVVGTIGGVTATGSGQFLTGTGAASGLKILINGGALGDRGSISFARGFAERFDSFVSSLLDDEGIFSSTIDSIESRIDGIGDDREVLSRRLASMEQRLRDQFIALDLFVSQSQSTSSFLTSQLASLPPIGARRSGN